VVSCVSREPIQDLRRHRDSQCRELAGDGVERVGDDDAIGAGVGGWTLEMV